MIKLESNREVLPNFADWDVFPGDRANKKDKLHYFIEKNNAGPRIVEFCLSKFKFYRNSLFCSSFVGVIDTKLAQ